MLVGKRGTFIQIVQINQLVDGRLTVEVKQEEVDDPHLEAAVVAKMGTVKEAGLLGS
jgi:hypothetical protein